MASTRRDATVTRLVNVFRAGRDAHDYRRREARELFAETASGLGGVGAETANGARGQLSGHRREVFFV